MFFLESTNNLHQSVGVLQNPVLVDPWRITLKPMRDNLGTLLGLLHLNKLQRRGSYVNAK